MTLNFDRIARPYRALEYLTLGRVLERTRLYHLAALAGCRQALLLGDGDGRFTAALLLRYPHLHAHAVDLSPRMLALLRARTPARHLQTTCADARTFTPTSTPDLLVTHFFLDCLTQPETDALIPRLTAHSAPGALWLVSEFAIPPGLLRLPARVLIRALYLAFRVLTGLRVTEIPDYRTPLTRAGFRLLAEHRPLAGLLQTTLWQRSDIQAPMSTQPQSPELDSQTADQTDAQPNPEPASPSLDAPDPAVFHHDVPPKN